MVDVSYCNYTVSFPMYNTVIPYYTYRYSVYYRLISLICYINLILISFIISMQSALVYIYIYI